MKNSDVINDVIHMVSNIWPLDGSSGNVGKWMAAKWSWFKTSMGEKFWNRREDFVVFFSREEICKNRNEKFHKISKILPLGIRSFLNLGLKILAASFAIFKSKEMPFILSWAFTLNVPFALTVIRAPSAMSKLFIRANSKLELLN